VIVIYRETGTSAKAALTYLAVEEIDPNKKHRFKNSELRSAKLTSHIMTIAIDNDVIRNK